VYRSALAFTVVKYAGALYLIYLAFKALKESGTLFSSFDVKETDVLLLYKRGIVMNILNPKVSLFFLAFLPQFISTSAGNVPMQMVFLGVVFLAQALIVFFLVAIFAGLIGSRIMQIPNAGKYINWAKAGIFSIIGLELALSNR
jgi:threonine/homoserine/homoserine lactone efflux protein